MQHLVSRRALGRWLAACSLLVSGCGEPASAPDGGPVGEPLSCGVEPCAFVISALRPPRMDADGRVVGVDLDGHVSDEGDARSCGHADFVAPDGTVGVDNQFVLMASTFETAVGESVGDGLARAIGRGDFLFAVTLAAVESTEDPNVRVEAGPTMLVGDGEPGLDADGQLQPDQDLAWLDAPTTGEGSIADGRLDAPIGDMQLVWVLDDITSDAFPLNDVRLRAPIGMDGLGTGLLVGRIVIDDVIASLAPSPDPGDSLIRNALEDVADLEPNADGVCQAISVAFEVELVRARIEP